MKPAEAARLIAALQSAFPPPRFQISAETTQTYTAFLSPLKHDAAKLAITDHIQTSDFFPTIAEIRRRYFEAQRGRDPARFMLPATGETIATAEQVRDAMAKATAIVKSAISDPRAKRKRSSEESEEERAARKAAELELEGIKGRKAAPKKT